MHFRSVHWQALWFALLFLLNLKVTLAGGPSEGTSGHVFVGAVTRHLDVCGNVTDVGSAAQWKCAMRCERWGVVTTIFPATEALHRFIEQQRGWCLVVVGDEKGPQDVHAYGDEAAGVVFLNAERQRALATQVPWMTRLPWNHFGRKNVGYLYAVACGARLVWDFDDDNLLKRPDVDIEQQVRELPTRLVSALNPYREFSDEVIWPRGMPLPHVKQAAAADSESKLASSEVVSSVLGSAPALRTRAAGFSHHRLSSHTKNSSARHGDVTGETVDGGGAGSDETPAVAVAVVQSLADGDPDVDAIYRLTRPLPFDWPRGAEQQKAIVYQPAKGAVVPYNAQATLHHYDALWATLLPISVHGRVSDIWRGFFAAPVFAATGHVLMFTSPLVEQRRNEHELMGDFVSEQPLYAESPALVELLRHYRLAGPRKIRSVPEAMVHVWREMYERQYIEIEDLCSAEHWLHTLQAVGYRFPSLLTV